jgi:hypothetical protein
MEPTEREWLEGLLPEQQDEKCSHCHTIDAHEPGCLASGERCPECWGEQGQHLFNCSRFYDALP